MAAFYSCLRGKNSDCGIMASGSADAIAAALEPSDAADECSGKKKSKFQTFKNFFVKKKRKEAAAQSVESEVQLKPSQSSEDVTTPEATPIRTLENMDSGSKMDIGSKALSHDSVFTSDSPCSEKNDALQASQDSIHGKVKSLQLQLKQAIKLGSPPVMISMRKSDDGGVLSEDDGLPCSPSEYSPLHTVLTSSQRSSGVVQLSSSLSLEGSESDDDQISGASSRPGTPQVSTPVDFSQPATSVSCLDSSAAHHRIAVKANACAKRKPASRETRRRDLREKVLLRDTGDKLRASGTFTEEDEDKEDAELIGEVHEGSERSSSVLAQPEEDVSSQRASTSAASVTTSEDEECVPDKDHVPNLEIQESPWEHSMTVELQADDFLLDTGCEVISEDQGSLLMEVLSSLKDPLTSGLVLESKVAVEQMKMEDTPIKDLIIEDMTIEDATAEDSTVEEKIIDDVKDNLIEDGVTDLHDSSDPTLALEEQTVPVENPLFESAKHQQALEELDYVLEKEDEPEEQEFAEEPLFEDLQVNKNEFEIEICEGEKDQDDINEEGDEAVETMEGSFDLEEEEKALEENVENEHPSEDEGDAEKTLDHQEESVIEDDEEASQRDEQEGSEEGETEDETCQVKDDEQQEVTVDTSIEVESSLHVDDQSFYAEDLIQPEAIPAWESVEQPSFVVTTSLDLSSPKRISDQPEAGLEILHKETTEIMEGYQEWSTEGPQLVQEDEETEEQLSSEKHHPSTTESQSDFTSDASWPAEAVQEPNEEVSPSAGEEEPSSSDQSFVSTKTELSCTLVENQGVTSTPVLKEICQAPEDAPENPFGVRLRKTLVLHRYASEGETPAPVTQTEPEETQNTVFLELAKKPVLPKKPDQLADGAVKPRRSSDVVGGKASVENPEAPSWISLAKQKQKLFKENSMDEASQEELSKKDALPDVVSPVTKDLLKPVASPVKVSCSLEISKPALVEKDKRSIGHPTPAPLTQDEPPWLALAKKKAKAWSEMPQIVQ